MNYNKNYGIYTANSVNDNLPNSLSFMLSSKISMEEFSPKTTEGSVEFSERLSSSGSSTTVSSMMVRKVTCCESPGLNLKIIVVAIYSSGSDQR